MNIAYRIRSCDLVVLNPTLYLIAIKTLMEGCFSSVYIMYDSS